MLWKCKTCEHGPCYFSRPVLTDAETSVFWGTGGAEFEPRVCPLGYSEETPDFAPVESPVESLASIMKAREAACDGETDIPERVWDITGELESDSRVASVAVVVRQSVDALDCDDWETRAELKEAAEKAARKFKRAELLETAAKIGFCAGIFYNESDRRSHCKDETKRRLPNCLWN